MYKDNENWPDVDMGKMMVITLDEFRNGIVDLYREILTGSLDEHLREGCDFAADLLSKGIDNMGIEELADKGSAFIDITMDMDTSLDGIVVWDGVDMKSATLVAFDHIDRDKVFQEKQEAQKQEEETTH